MTDPLDPARVAARVAPIIDRLRMAIAGGVGRRTGELPTPAGLDPEGVRTVAMLRNLRPDRIVERDQVDAVFAYVPADAGLRAIGQVIESAWWTNRRSAGCG